MDARSRRRLAMRASHAVGERRKRLLGEEALEPGGPANREIARRDEASGERPS